ncbi:MAG TPA: hypothetical protein VGF79_03480 [Bacteroidia bacterium]
MKFFNSILFVLLALFQFENVCAQTFTAKDMEFNRREFDSLRPKSEIAIFRDGCYLNFYSKYYDPSSNKNDSELITEHQNLWKKEPEEYDHYLYAELALAYYRVKDYTTAEIMFKKIIESELQCYNQMVYYPYRGSYEVSYESDSKYETPEHHKHKAATYLAYIYLKRKDYQIAYDCAMLALRDYSKGYFGNYEDHMDELIFECMYHLGEYQMILDKYFVEYFFCDNTSMTDVLLKLYTREQLRDSMNAAVSTIRYTISKPGTSTWYGDYGMRIRKTQSINSSIFLWVIG